MQRQTQSGGKTEMEAELVKSQEELRKRIQDKNTRQKDIIETGRQQGDTDKRKRVETEKLKEIEIELDGKEAEQQK